MREQKVSGPHKEPGAGLYLSAPQILSARRGCTVLLLHLGHGFAEGIDEAVHRHAFGTLGSSVSANRNSWRVSMKKHMFLLLNNGTTFFVFQPDIW